VDVEQDHREIPVEELAQGLPSGAGLDDLWNEVLEHHLEGEEVLRVIVHEEDARSSGRRRLRLAARAPVDVLPHFWSQTRSRERRCSTSTGFGM
jgi:hypothetical protein